MDTLIKEMEDKRILPIPHEIPRDPQGCYYSLYGISWEPYLFGKEAQGSLLFPFSAPFFRSLGPPGIPKAPFWDP